jgi:hypothetical protein
MSMVDEIQRISLTPPEGISRRSMDIFTVYPYWRCDRTGTPLSRLIDLKRGELLSEGLNGLIRQPSIFFDGCFLFVLSFQSIKECYKWKILTHQPILFSSKED